MQSTHSAFCATGLAGTARAGVKKWINLLINANSFPFSLHQQYLPGLAEAFILQAGEIDTAG